MGVFIYALDAVTGRVIWENSGTGSIYIQQQHNSPAFAGVAPQGYLAADGDKLLVTSRTTPACFNYTTGELLYYPLSDQLRQVVIGWGIDLDITSTTCIGFRWVGLGRTHVMGDGVNG
jgi:hypothetical protein